VDAVTQVRSFNRTVTERVGALQDHYLARDRPLGPARVLWEVDGAVDVRALRERLGLDSGYLSRLLRSLEGEGLVTLEPDAGDRRVRRIRLTEAGRRERALLDERSDALAASLLAPLSDPQRERLVEAMRTVERLLTAGLVDVAVEDARSAAARFCLDRYFAEIDARFEHGFDPAHALPLDAADMTEPAGLLLVARLRGEPVGCGALKFYPDAPAYLKRMWISPSARGLGLGRRMLAELEEQARRHGAPAVQLETNRALREAIALYRSSSYTEIEPFNAEPYAHHWFEKRF
jgi:DNA-binding MarR family transcriptional regulator/GNAT superfamily N-acetyltransferase